METAADSPGEPTPGSPLTLCHLIASNFAGGPEKQILESSARLVESGWRVSIASFLEGRSGVEIVDRARERGLETFLIDTRSPFSPDAIRQLRKHLDTTGSDVLLTHGYKSNVVGTFATRGTAVRKIPVVRGFTAEDWKVRLYEVIDRIFLRRAQQVIAVSEATRDMLVREGLRAERIEVLQNAVDCEREVEALDLRAEFDLPEDAVVAVAAGRLSPEKSHRHLVEAAAQLDPRVQVLIFGSGREETALRNQIDELGLADRVHLAGFRKDVLRCLAGADLVVNPSLTEGLPNVVLEAMAVRTAVVATDVGGVSELVLPQRTGWLVPAGDVTSLAAAMSEAVSDAELRRAMAQAGREHVERTFSFTEQTRRYRRFLAG